MQKTSLKDDYISVKCSNQVCIIVCCKFYCVIELTSETDGAHAILS